MSVTSKTHSIGENILIVKPSSLGDVLHAFPALNLIKRIKPNSNVDWLVNPAFAPLLEYQDVRKTIPFHRRKLGSPISFLPTFLKLLCEIRKNKYDLVIDYQGLLRSAIISNLAPSNRVFGFAEPKEKICAHMYGHVVSPPEHAKHAVERNIHLTAGALGCDYFYSSPNFPVLDKYHKSTNKLLENENLHENPFLIAIAPGARWETKKWPAHFFASIIDHIAPALPTAIFPILGDSSDIESANKIITLSKHSNRIISFAGKTGLGELVELLRRCKTLITNDSGPMHLAAALKIPVYAFFGPTDPDLTGPYGKNHEVFQSDLACIKCLKRYCPAVTLECQRLVDPIDVAKRVLEKYLR